MFTFEFYFLGTVFGAIIIFLVIRLELRTRAKWEEKQKAKNLPTEPAKAKEENPIEKKSFVTYSSAHLNEPKETPTAPKVEEKPIEKPISTVYTEAFLKQLEESEPTPKREETIEKKPISIETKKFVNYNAIRLNEPKAKPTAPKSVKIVEEKPIEEKTSIPYSKVTTTDTYLVFNVGNQGSTTSMRAIGLVLVRGNEIIKTYHSHIRVYLNDESLPSLSDVWHEVKPFFDEADFYVCFKNAVHKPTLINSFALMGHTVPSKDILCVSTLALARLKDIKSSMESLITHFEIDIEGSNLYDLNAALLSNAILSKLLALSEPTTIRGIIDEKKNKKVRLSKPKVLKDVELYEPESIEEMEGKTFLITGIFSAFDRDELVNLLEEKGLIARTGLSSKLDYLIIGEEAGWAKLEKAMLLQHNGAKLKGITDETITYLLREYL